MNMTREDTYKMTREDVLRELELLPVWTLRAPMPAQPITESIQPVSVAIVEIEPTENASNKIAFADAGVLIVSDDKKWAFVLAAELTGQALDLFNNILRALGINKTQTSQSQQLSQDIADLDVSMVVAMGETVAQQLLASTQSIEYFRGKLHVVNSAQMIVTYHPNAILQHLPNKAKTWDDFCMALGVMNAR